MPNRYLTYPEFGPIKVRLGRAYLEHKGDLGARGQTQRSLRTSMRSLHSCWPRRSGRGAPTSSRWKERYRWFFEAIAELQDALPGKPLDI